MTRPDDRSAARGWPGRWPMVALVLAALLMAGWYLAGPWWAMRQLRAAAEAGDTAALSQRIDFPAVRQSIKNEVREVMARQLAGDPAAAGIEALGAAMLPALVDPLVDGIVTPEALANVVMTGRLARGEGLSDKDTRRGLPDPVRRATRGGADRPESDPAWRITRHGLSRFSVRRADDRAGDGPALLFERRGLGWRMTGVDFHRDGDMPVLGP